MNSDEQQIREQIENLPVSKWWEWVCGSIICGVGWNVFREVALCLYLHVGWRPLNSTPPKIVMQLVEPILAHFVLNFVVTLLWLWGKRRQMDGYDRIEKIVKKIAQTNNRLRED